MSAQRVRGWAPGPAPTQSTVQVKLTPAHDGSPWVGASTPVNARATQSPSCASAARRMCSGPFTCAELTWMVPSGCAQEVRPSMISRRTGIAARHDPGTLCSNSASTRSWAAGSGAGGAGDGGDVAGGGGVGVVEAGGADRGGSPVRAAAEVVVVDATAASGAVVEGAVVTGAEVEGAVDVGPAVDGTVNDGAALPERTPPTADAGPGRTARRR